MITLIVIITVIVVLLVNKSDKKKSEKAQGEMSMVSLDDEVRKINAKILTELDKAEPNVEKMKELRAEMKELKKERESKVISSEKVESQKAGMFQPAATEEGAGGGAAAALYAGSLLLLAGVGGLTWSGAGEVSLPLLILAVIIFYFGGIAMRASEKFKMVSNAFVGTGMAMVPFVGILFCNLTGADARVVWLVLSLIGVPMLVYATYAMNNKVFSFLAIAGFVSLSCSLSSVMGLGMVWYFALLMGLGVVFDLVQIFVKSEKLGAMTDAIRVAGEWLPLGVLVASLFAAAQLTEGDYLLLTTIMLAQLMVNFWHNQNVIWENILRAAIPIWGLQVVHMAMPTNLAMGVSLMLLSSAELACSFFMMAGKKGTKKTERKVIEALWLIVVMIGYVVAGLLIAEFTAPGAWIALLVMLGVDALIMIAARFQYEVPEWYYGLVPIGVAVPIIALQLTGLTAADKSGILFGVYLIEALAMAALEWAVKKYEADARVGAVASAGLIVFGLAAFVAKPAFWVAGVILMLFALGVGGRGFVMKKPVWAEVGVYLGAAAVMAFMFEAMQHTAGVWPHIVNAHVILVAMLITSALWDGKEKNRATIGMVGLLLVLAGVALSGMAWTMILFMLEAAAILVCGLVVKQKAFWITGTVALFLAVLWFTRGLSFVWPILLGLGLIGAVVVTIMRNNRK